MTEFTGTQKFFFYLYCCFAFTKVSLLPQCWASGRAQRLTVRLACESTGARALVHSFYCASITPEFPMSWQKRDCLGWNGMERLDYSLID
jgi:hypothetical protein